MPALDTLLRTHQAMMRHTRASALLADETQRQRPLSFEIGGQLYVDFSKHPINDETIDLLLQACHDANVIAKRDAMVAGAAINTAEQRPALHMALRSGPGQRNYLADGEPVSPEVERVVTLMADFTQAVASGARKSATGSAFKHVVNIGIGGSDLGPRMVCQALRPFATTGLTLHFVSNVDPSELEQTLATLDPSETLFVVASKTFTTQETLTNANAARRWLAAGLSHCGDAALGGHFVAVTAAPSRAADFGIDPTAIFPFWDWVGGRYSLWSAIGLPIMLAIGAEGFRALLAGAHAMDEHFISAPLDQNVPVLMGALSYYYRNYWGAASHAVLPYDQNLEALPAYLQQLEMESNGKSVTSQAQPVRALTSPVIWGAAGTNAQHSFFQCLHQGTDTVTMDMLAAAKSQAQDQDQHQILLANFLAQGQAFLEGQDQALAKRRFLAKGMSDEQAALAAINSQIVGNRPVTMMIYPELTPWIMGALVALYEHRVFVQAALCDINPFDQWGVELGKVLAKEILPALTEGKAAVVDPSTATLMAKLKGWQA